MIFLRLAASAAMTVIAVVPMNPVTTPGAAPVAVVVPSEADPQLPPRCTAQRLPQLDGETHSEVHAGDPRGRWLVGMAITGGSAIHGVRWHGGTVQELDVPLQSVTLSGVARGGDVAGSGTQSGQSKAFAFVGGTYVALATPAGASNAYGIAVNKDRVTGAVDLDSGIAPVVWMLDKPADPIILELPPGFRGYPVGMTPRGQVLVAAQDPGFASHAFVFSPALERHELERPAGEEELRASAVARGLAATWLPSGDEVLLFDLRTREPVTLHTPLLPEAVNSSGAIAGTDRYDLTAGIFVGGRGMDLPALVPGGTATVTAISEHGRLAGTAERAGGAFAAVSWRCA